MHDSNRPFSFFLFFFAVVADLLVFLERVFPCDPAKSLPRRERMSPLPMSVPLVGGGVRF